MPSHRIRTALALVVAILSLALCFGKVADFRGWDNAFYLGQTSSLVEDGDLDLRNDAMYSQLSAVALGRFLSTTDDDGNLANTFAIGTSLFWAPAYLVAMPLEGALAGGAPIRWGPVETAALYLLSLGLTLGIAWFLFFWLRWAGVGRRFALAGSLTLLLGSPLLFYAFYEYTMSHQTSTLAVCLFLATVTWLEREATPGVAFLCGVALGVVYLCRWQDIIVALALLVPTLQLVRKIPLRRLTVLALALAAGAAPVAGLQSQAWSRELGLLLSMPQGSDYMNWLRPELGRFLFSGYSGLLPWAPLLVVGPIGLALPWRCRIHRSWAFVALVVVVTDLYVNAAVSDWWGGASYGPRRMTSALPFVALGIANLILLLPRRLVAAGLLMTSLWGVFTGNLAVNGVQDLSLVLLGRASDAPGTEREIPQPSAADARRLARSWPIVVRGGNLWAASARLAPRAGKILTLLMAAATLLLVALLLVRLRARTTLTASLLALFGLTLAAHARLAFGPPREPAERRLWASLSRTYRSPRPDLDAIEGALAARAERSFVAHEHTDALRFVAALAFLRSGQMDRAEDQMTMLRQRQYPVAFDLTRLLPSRVDRLLTLIGGPFHTVVRGERYLMLPLPDFEADRQSLHLELDFSPGPMRTEASYPLLALRVGGQTRAAISVSGADSTRLDGDESAVGPGVDWHAHATYRIRFTWGESADLLRLDVSAAGAPPVTFETRLSLPAQRIPDLQFIFGRPREWRGEETLWEASYANLRIEARGRQGYAEARTDEGELRVSTSATVFTR